MNRQAYKLTRYEKFLKVVSPAKATKHLIDRSMFEAVATGAYAGTVQSRGRNFYAYGRSLQDTEVQAMNQFDRSTMILESMDLYRNCEITNGSVNRIADYTVFTGPLPLAQTSDENWNKLAQSFWTQGYAPRIDYRQRPGTDVRIFCKLIVKHTMRDGGLGFIMRKNGQLQPVESIRIQTPDDKKTDPEVFQGVQTKKGVVTGYWIVNRDTNGRLNSQKAQFVKRENFIYCCEPDRVDQYHCPPRIHALIGKFRDYCETDQHMLQKVKHDATWLAKKTIQGAESDNDNLRNAYILSGADDKDQQRVIKRDWGSEIGLQPGEDYSLMGSENPNSEHTPYLEFQLRSIAMCLGIPFEYMMLIFTNGSFSAQRAAMLHANHAFDEWLLYLVRCFLSRVWNWRVAKAMKDGELPLAPLDPLTGMSQWHKVEWIVPTTGWVDPKKQTEAEKGRITVGTDSVTSVTKQHGRDRDDVFAEKANDIKAAAVIAEQLNKDKPEAAVTWRDITDTGSKVTGQAIVQVPAEGEGN